MAALDNLSNLCFTIIMDEISIFTFDNTILRFTRIQQRKERKETMEEKKVLGRNSTSM